MSRRPLVALVALALLPIGLPSAEASWLRPTSTASGTVRITWQETLERLVPQRITRSGQVDYTVLRRLASPDEAESWVPGAVPEWSDSTTRIFGFFLMARVSSISYTSVSDYVCESGAAAQTTTTVASVTQPNALLMVNEPDLNLLRGTGRMDVDLAFDVNQDGIYRLGQAVFATGEVSLHTTGTDCSGSTEEGVRVPAPVDTTSTATVSRLLGEDITVAAVDAYQGFPGQLTDSGGLRLDVTRTLPDLGDWPEAETRSGSYDLDLVFGGPPHSLSARCALPRQRHMSEADTLDEARAVLRRAGFPKAPYGGSKLSTVRKGRFFLDWGGSSSICGHRLGTGTDPVLFRSQGNGQ